MMPVALQRSLPRGLFLVSPAGHYCLADAFLFPLFLLPLPSHQKFSLCAVISPFTWLGNQRLWQLGKGGALSAWPRVLATGQSLACYKKEWTLSPAHLLPTQFRGDLVSKTASVCPMLWGWAPAGRAGDGAEKGRESSGRSGARPRSPGGCQ